MRLHYIQQGKFANPEQRAALMQNQDSFNRFIETRFKQLQVATHLDLWQEAYKSMCLPMLAGTEQRPQRIPDLSDA